MAVMKTCTEPLYGMGGAMLNLLYKLMDCSLLKPLCLRLVTPSASEDSSTGLENIKKCSRWTNSRVAWSNLTPQVKRPNSEEYNYIYLWNDEQTTAAYCTAVHDIIGRFYFRFTWMESTYSEHARSRIVE